MFFKWWFYVSFYVFSREIILRFFTFYVFSNILHILQKTISRFLRLRLCLRFQIFLTFFVNVKIFYDFDFTFYVFFTFAILRFILRKKT